MDEGTIIRRIDAYLLSFSFVVLLVPLLTNSLGHIWEGGREGGREELRESYWLFVVETQLCVLQPRFLFFVFFFFFDTADT